MSEQPRPPAEPGEPTTEPVPLTPMPEPPAAGTPASPVAPPSYRAQEPSPSYQAQEPSPSYEPGAAPPPPPIAPPPVYDWQRPAEQVGPAPGVRFAGFGARLVAYIIDIALVLVAVVVAAIVLGIVVAALASAGSNGAAGLTGLLLFVVLLVVSIGYFPYFWARDGQTPGMRMLRIRVVRDRDGGPVTGGQAVLRLIGYWLSGAVFYLGYIWIFIDGRRRGWHDLIAGTVVIEA